MAENAFGKDNYGRKNVLNFDFNNRLDIFVIIWVTFLTLFEQKVLSYIQFRKGPNDPKIAIAQSMSTECGAISDPDRCELAAKGYECGVESAKKHGFKFSDFI